mgnify:FL=1
MKVIIVIAILFVITSYSGGKTGKKGFGCSGGNVCVPNCNNAPNICQGILFTDSCGNVNACTGTKICETGCLNPCPTPFRCVDYKPLTDAEPHFVSRITTGGNQCVLRENYIPDYSQNPSKYQTECNNANGDWILIDGAVIIGGYDYDGQNSGGCWAKAGSGESNQRCTQAGGTVNSNNFVPENCPSDCHLITSSEEYYVDLPFCFRK